MFTAALSMAANAPEREESLQRYRSKRARRGTHEPVRYAGRKATASARCVAKSEPNFTITTECTTPSDLAVNIRQPPEVQNVHAPGCGLQAVTRVFSGLRHVPSCSNSPRRELAILQMSTASPVPHASLCKEPFYNSFIDLPDHTMFQLLGK